MLTSRQLLVDTGGKIEVYALSTNSYMTLIIRNSSSGPRRSRSTHMFIVEWVGSVYDIWSAPRELDEGLT